MTERRVAGTGLRLKGNLSIEIDEELDCLDLNELSKLFKRGCQSEEALPGSMQASSFEGVQSPHYYRERLPVSGYMISSGE